jgi:hypothetical protein
MSINRLGVRFGKFVRRFQDQDLGHVAKPGHRLGAHIGWEIITGSTLENYLEDKSLG